MCVLAGGLADTVTPEILTSAFIPFGDVSQVDIPVDPGTRTCPLLAFAGRHADDTR